VLVERVEERLQRRAENALELAAPRDHALIAAGKAFDEREVGLGRTHDVAEHDVGGGPREYAPMPCWGRFSTAPSRTGPIISAACAISGLRSRS
jgi:hypothetical protein